MRPVDKEVFNKKAEQLKNETGIDIDAKELFSIIGRMESEIREFDRNEKTEFLLDKFKILYQQKYVSFMKESLGSEIKSDEDKMSDFIKFNDFMSSLLTRVYSFNTRSEDNKEMFYYGGMSDKEMSVANNELLSNLATKRNYMNAFRAEMRKENTSIKHFAELQAEIDKENNLFKANGENHVRTADERLIPLYVSLVNHYNKRSIFSQWLTPSGYHERSLIKNMKGMIADAVHDPDLKNKTNENFETIMRARVCTDKEIYITAANITKEICEKCGEGKNVKLNEDEIGFDKVNKKLIKEEDELKDNVFAYDTNKQQIEIKIDNDIDNHIGSFDMEDEPVKNEKSLNEANNEEEYDILNENVSDILGDD